MKLGLLVLGVLATSCALMGFGCVDPTGTSTTTSSSSSSSSSGETTGSSSSTGSSGTGGGGGSASSSSSSSSSGNGMYTTCSECTSNTTGAYSKECKAQSDACSANADCVAIFECSLQTCSTTKDGGCCTLACANGKPQAAQDLFFALDKCVYCTTCTSLCEGDPLSAKAYCDSLNGVTMCP